MSMEMNFGLHTFETSMLRFAGLCLLSIINKSISLSFVSIPLAEEPKRIIFSGLKFSKIAQS